MKWRAGSQALEPRYFEIKHDPLVGFYLYVFENGQCIRDHLQDTFEIAIESAFEDYGVPKDAWRKVEDVHRAEPVMEATSESKPPFIFISDPSALAREQDFLLEVPAGIQTKMDLLAHYENEGNFPGYFGRNWDALQDCLLDFSWTNQKRIIIAHKDLPLASREDELRVYLEILESAVMGWKEVRQGPFAELPNGMRYVEHELIVVFPSAVEATVIRVLDEQNS